MKKVNTNLIKDLIISILIVICIALVISVIFYNKISLNKIIPESQEYSLSTEMQQDLDKSDIEEDTEIITTYSIDAADLKKYEKTKEYNKGKKNPFAEESIEEKPANNVNNINSNNTSSTSGNNFYEDDGTK